MKRHFLSGPFPTTWGELPGVSHFKDTQMQGALQEQLHGYLPALELTPSSAAAPVDDSKWGIKQSHLRRKGVSPVSPSRWAAG